MTDEQKVVAYEYRKLPHVLLAKKSFQVLQEESKNPEQCDHLFFQNRRDTSLTRSKYFPCQNSAVFTDHGAGLISVYSGGQ